MKSSRLILFAILLAAFAYRLFRLGANSLWYDETVSLYLARLDLFSLTRHTAGDIHPPLYYYLLHFWVQFVGGSEFSAAFLSLCFGIILVALTARVAREWFDPRVATLSAFLIAISPYNLWYSQEVRMYTLGAVLGLASVYFFLKLMTSPPTPAANSKSIFTRNFFAYVIVSALGLYTLYYFIFLLAFEYLVVLVRRIRFSDLWITKYDLRVFLLSQLFILLLYLPWLFIAVRQAIDPPVPPWRSFIPLSNILRETFSALALGQSVEPRDVWWVLVIVAAVIAFALFDRRRKTMDSGSATDDGRPTIFLFAYTFVSLALIYAFSFWKPLYHVRYIFIYSPAFYILLAVGITRIANGRWRIANSKWRMPNYFLRNTQYAIIFIFAVASAFSAFNFWFDARYAEDDLRGAVNYLSEHWRPGDAILLNAGYTYPAFLYYSDLPIAWRGRLRDYPPSQISVGTIQRVVDNPNAFVLQTGSINGAANLGWGSAESDFYATTADETRAALDRVFALHARVWMLRLYDTVVDPDGIIRDYFATRGRIIDDQVFAGEANARVQGYLTTRAPLTTLPTNLTRRDLNFQNGINLRGFESDAQTARVGASVDFILYWQAREALNVDARVFIGLFDERGNVVAASEEAPGQLSIAHLAFRSVY
ncbi:MAG: glycosyltransferase family 39 protein [Chloroflexi bacterium]|nr:glycosyltransferase family 39 protein [Chloroflexota bacterium]